MVRMFLNYSQISLQLSQISIKLNKPNIILKRKHYFIFSKNLICRTKAQRELQKIKNFSNIRTIFQGALQNFNYPDCSMVLTPKPSLLFQMIIIHQINIDNQKKNINIYFFLLIQHAFFFFPYYCCFIQMWFVLCLWMYKITSSP